MVSGKKKTKFMSGFDTLWLAVNDAAAAGVSPNAVAATATCWSKDAPNNRQAVLKRDEQATRLLQCETGIVVAKVNFHQE
jgi:hypothetical protein